MSDDSVLCLGKRVKVGQLIIMKSWVCVALNFVHLSFGRFIECGDIILPGESAPHGVRITFDNSGFIVPMSPIRESLKEPGIPKDFLLGGIFWNADPLKENCTNYVQEIIDDPELIKILQDKMEAWEQSQSCRKIS